MLNKMLEGKALEKYKNEEFELKILLDNGTDVDKWYQEEVDNNLSKPTPIVSNDISNTNFKGSIFDDDKWDYANKSKSIWDPYLFEWIDEDDYKSIYGIPYTGQFKDLKPASLYSKKGKKHGSSKYKNR